MGTGGGSGLRAVSVADVMTHPLVTCAGDVLLREVAELMARHRIHCVVVLTGSDPAAPFHRRWALISDLDLVAAAPWDPDGTTAASIAGSPAVVVAPTDSLAAAALCMAENQTTHILVVDPGADEPAGILSALDLAAALAPAPPAGAPRPAMADLSARPGDLLRITAHHQGDRPRDAEVLEARGPGGGAPFLVRWEDTGRTTLHYPGPDARVVRPE
jgi:CBS domain-containing protein